jgi:hypothetical protein
MALVNFIIPMVIWHTKEIFQITNSMELAKCLMKELLLKHNKLLIKILTYLMIIGFLIRENFQMT